METLTECNLCGAPSYTPIAELPGERTDNVFALCRCDACGLMFISPRLTEEENAALYDEDYYKGNGFDSSTNYLAFDNEQAKGTLEGTGILEKIRVFCSARDARILDVGCGTGSLLVTLKEAGYARPEGLEYSAYASAIARERTGLEIHQGDILTTKLTGKFDVVNATEVIEHLRDPKRFFHRVSEILAPGGVFVYSTGNRRGPYARLMGLRWPYIHPEGHLFYYSPDTLTRYFDDAGLTSISAHDLEPARRARLIAAERTIAFAQLVQIGNSDGGLKGSLYRAMSKVPRSLRDPTITWLAGKHMLPTARKPQ